MFGKFDSVVFSLRLFRYFMMYCRSELNKIVLSGFPCLLPRSRWKCLLLTSVCTVARCWSYSFVSNFMYGSSMPCNLEAFHTLLCSTVSNAFLKSMAATHGGWCHSVALYRSCWNVNKVGCRGVARSEACLVNRLVGV